MAQYLMKYKGIYRLLPELDVETNDFPRDANGNMDTDDIGVYISCQYGNKIMYWGLNESRRGVLIGYVSSKSRGRNIKKAMDKMGIEYFDYDESDEEAMFKFNASDIEQVAELLKARTNGAKTSPFSPKNLPKRKDIVIPDDELKKYQEATNQVGKTEMLLFKTLNYDFFENVLQKKMRKKNRKFDYKSDMKREKLSRQTKEYIYYRGMWDEYVEFLREKIAELYDNK